MKIARPFFRSYPLISLMISRIALLASAPVLAAAHSFLIQVGSNGIQRGGLDGTDLDRQRYYCPLDDLSKCVATSSGIVLTEDSKRPCRQGKSPVEATGTAGDPFYVEWAGNGHVGKDNGTCVSISIAPYSNDPNPGDFQTLQSCAPYSHDDGMTNTYVTLPANLATGEYTIFWLWPFAEFYYSSCADITVTSSVSTTSAPSDSTSTTSAPSDTTTTVAPDTTVPSNLAIADSSLTGGCQNQADPDVACKSYYGNNSYCKKDLVDHCGFAWCQGQTDMPGC